MSSRCEKIKPPQLCYILNNFNIVIKTSKIPDSGEGVFNLGQTIKSGTIFGPYPGEYFSCQAYNLKFGNDISFCSRNVFYVEDSSGCLIGHIEPGNYYNPGKGNYWMFKINHQQTAKPPEQYRPF